eukprot:12402150-Alexandrium_andersonii.AAC.1
MGDASGLATPNQRECHLPESATDVSDPECSSVDSDSELMGSGGWGERRIQRRQRGAGPPASSLSGSVISRYVVDWE